MKTVEPDLLIVDSIQTIVTETAEQSAGSITQVRECSGALLKFAKESGWLGQIDIDIFDVNGEYYISEVNPRFGGGYPHAFECGCDHMSLILNNLSGKENNKNIGNYDSDIYMMKYNEIMIRK